MLKKYLFQILCVLISFTATAQNDVYFATTPSLSPDGRTIYFSYEGDIWSVTKAGGQAMRITGMPGNETHPRVSPDGNWLAFSGSQDGNSNVYVMPIGGGPIKQLTYHDGSDQIYSWSWDSEELYFSSGRYNSVSVYSISKDGGNPSRLFDHYFNIPHDLVIHPNGEEVYFTDTWESNNQVQRKRYKGAFNPDIKTYNIETDTYGQLTTWEGKDMWPSISQDGKLYFASDEGNEEYNLYTFENGVKTALTQFETSIWNPQVSANGSTIVFEKDYQLFTYDVASKQSSPVKISMAQSSILEIEKNFATATNITNFDVSPDNNKIAFVSRGVLFVSDIKGKFVRQIPTDPNERVVEVLWLKDNENLIYSQSAKGWQNLYTSKADGTGQQKRLTETERSERQLVMSPDKSKMIYYGGRDEVMIMNLADFSATILAEDELWGFQNGALNFSPDGKWVAYNATRNFEKEVILVNVASKQTINLTHTVVSETDPYWSPDGKYVYFATDRTKPSYPTGGTNPSIYRVALTNEETPFKAEEFNKLFAEKPKEEAKTEVTVKIDTIDLDRRWERVTSGSGNQSRPMVISKGGKDYILYLSNQDGNGTTLWKTVQEKFEDDKTEKFKATRGNVGNLVLVGDKLYGLMGGDIHIVKYESSEVEKIAISHNFSKNLRNEFNQMFYETWSNIQENFYDRDFHGVDWSAMKTRYEAYLPNVNTREHLRIIMNHMMGELNASHLGFSSSGSEENETFSRQTTWHSGIVFNNDNPLVVERIISYSPASKNPKEVLAGDRLVAVNDVAVDGSKERYAYFNSPSRIEEMKLTLSRNGQNYDFWVKPISSGAMRSLLYDEWMDANQMYVDEKSGKKIAYIHMKNMSGGELTRFLEEMANEAQYRDGLILDLRNNTGGNVHDQVLQTLSQKTYSEWQYREGGRTSQPNFTPSDKPIILLQNEQSLSDAEMTANGFKALKLGKVVGTESYRWIIFTSGFGLVDGSFHRMPAWGCYDLDGNDLELTGVAPDIFVAETFMDRLEGKQPQLDKAIELIMSEIK